jgi:hypothetical protein
MINKEDLILAKRLTLLVLCGETIVCMYMILIWGLWGFLASSGAFICAIIYRYLSYLEKEMKKNGMY